jgi:alkylation response protein AidB-like acyl-CoA dehydrogenase
VRILDTWHTGGLRATGSHDVEVPDLWVPAARSFVVTPDAPRSAYHQGPLYRFPLFGALGTGISAVALGIARCAIDALIELARDKVPVGRSGALRDQAVIQAEVARAEAAVRSARTWLYDTVARIASALAGGAPVGGELRCELMLASAHATRSAASAVDRMHLAGGGSAIYSSSPLDRAHRDVHAATQHRRTAPIQFEITGRMLLGLDPDDPMVWQ